MTRKPVTLAASAILALTITGPAVAKQQQATEAVNWHPATVPPPAPSSHPARR